MKKRWIIFSFLCLFVISACTPKNPTIATTVYPVEYLVKKIGGEYVETVNISEDALIQRAKIKDNYEDLFKESDLLFYLGGLEPYMELYLDELEEYDVEKTDLLVKNGIYKFKRYTTTILDGKTVTAESDYYDSDLFFTQDFYKSDPTVWMDPLAMTSMADTIREYLSKEYPEYEKIFQANYDKLEMDLARLDADYQELKKMSQISFVSMTPNFGTWQKSFHVRVYPICLSRYGALPTQEQLEVIKNKIKEDGVRYIADEPNLPEDMKALQQELISELGLIPVSMHNLTSLSDADKNENKNYLTIMYENLKMLEYMAE